jgi:putative ABC transport system substrate-binding protein
LGASTRSAEAQWIAAFLQRLRELGWIEGRTIAIEYRWAESSEERFAQIATELVRLQDLRFAKCDGNIAVSVSAGVISPMLLNPAYPSRIPRLTAMIP